MTPVSAKDSVKPRRLHVASAKRFAWKAIITSL